MRPMFGVSPLSDPSKKAPPFNMISQAYVPSTSIMFVSQASIDAGTVQSYGIKKRIEAVKNCRNIGKADMKYNDTMPKMHVDAESYAVEADGVLCDAQPATNLPLTQDFFVY